MRGDTEGRGNGSRHAGAFVPCRQSRDWRAFRRFSRWPTFSDESGGRRSIGTAEVCVRLAGGVEEVNMVVMAHAACWPALPQSAREGRGILGLDTLGWEKLER